MGGPYRTLLFDLDGTLAETDSLHLPTWVGALLPHGIEVDEAFYRENISGRADAGGVGGVPPRRPPWVRALLPRGMGVDEAFCRENISGRANAEIVGDLLPNLSAREGREIVEAQEAGLRDGAGGRGPP